MTRLLQVEISTSHISCSKNQLHDHNKQFVVKYTKKAGFPSKKKVSEDKKTSK